MPQLFSVTNPLLQLGQRIISMEMSGLPSGKIRTSSKVWNKVPTGERDMTEIKSIPVSVINTFIKELEEIMDIIEPYDHPEFLYEHKEKLRDWYIRLKKEASEI